MNVTELAASCSALGGVAQTGDLTVSLRMHSPNLDDKCFLFPVTSPSRFPMSDHYDILSVAPSATQAQLKQAYLAKVNPLPVCFGNRRLAAARSASLVAPPCRVGPAEGGEAPIA